MRKSLFLRGKEVLVRSLQQRVALEIRDVDQWTTAEEVKEAAAFAVGEGVDSFRIVSHRNGFGGTKVVIISVSVGISHALLSAGRLRIGWVSCRIRLAKQRVRCFRCLSFGHMSIECDGPDRTECCRSCGETGHRAVVCKAPALAISAFAKTVGAVRVITKSS